MAFSSVLLVFPNSLCESEAFELHGEVAHERGFPGYAHAVGDLLATVVDVLQGGGNNGHVVVGVDATRYGQTQKVESAKTVFTRDGVAVGQEIAYFATADACFEVEFDGQCLGGKLLFGHVGEHFGGVDEDGVAAGGTLIGYAVGVEQLGKAFYLADARFQIVELGVLVESDGECVHVATVHSAVGQVAFKLHAIAFGALIPVFLVCGDEAAHVDESVFLGAHGHAIGQGKHFFGYLLDGLLGVGWLSGLDEVGVLGEAGRIEDDALAILVSYFADGFQVFHRDRLSASGVVCDGDDDEGHMVAMLFEHASELLGIDVAFEGNFELGVLGFVDGAIDDGGVAAFDVAFGRVEGRIAWNYVAVVHEVGEEHVFGGTSLVCGDDVFEARQSLYGFFQAEEGVGSGVAFVARHDASPLAVAHGSGARVGQKVDVHLVGA